MRTVLGLFVTMPVGGAENLWLNALRKLDRTRYNVITCCIADKGAVGTELEAEGFEVVSLGLMRGKRFDPGAVLAIARLMRGRGVDILHTHMYHAGLYGRLAALLAGGRRPKAKVVAMFHSLYATAKPHRVLVNRLLNRATDRLLAVSDAVREDVLRVEKASPGKVEVLRAAVDPARFDISVSREEARARIGLAAGDFVIGNVGRLVEEKGHRHLIRAFADMRRAGRDFKLVVAGGGRLMGEMKALAESLGVGEHVMLLGERRDVPELYRAMDVFVMPSVFEAWGLSLIEAMASGLPCVATSVGGMPEILDGGSCGVIVPKGDPGAIADAVGSLSSDPARMTELGARGRARALSLYGSEAMARKLEAVYDNLFTQER